MTTIAIQDLDPATPAEVAIASLAAVGHLRDERDRLRAENLKLRGELIVQACALHVYRQRELDDRQRQRIEREQAGAAADLAASQAGAS